MFSTNVKSIKQLLKEFPDEQSCIDYLTERRWKDGNVISPFDAESKVWKCKNNRYQCKNTGKYFNVKTATLFDNTKMPLQDWFVAIWIVTSFKKGFSSYQLAEQLDITQKSAWFMLQRIRACFGIENYNELDGTVEADESFYGGKNKNRHADKKVKKNNGRSFKDKTPILGLVERGGKLNAFVIPEGTKASVIQPLIKKYVKPRATFINDDWSGYFGLENRYDQFTIKHTVNGMHYGHPDPNIHTNTIEGAWKIMKNSMRDMYNHVTRKHMQKYVDEFVFRYNLRTASAIERVDRLFENMAVRTSYKMLTNG